eukprot:TRINITY_DN15752_c0_g1_i1.p1 TRINITY_DN15752_c0_g1~~TRINITY_DN15752_c0_g1_i1.p1  ORF type:complete len:432 (+),score=89.57 TRINITY_DN15752_c0_g1_i1:57-1298(+)
MVAGLPLESPRHMSWRKWTGTWGLGAAGTEAGLLPYVALVAVVLTYFTLLHLQAAGYNPVLLGALQLSLRLWFAFLLVYFCRRKVGAWFKALGSSVAGLGGAPSGRGPKTAKTTREGRGAWFSYVSCEMQGWRDGMEDAMVCVPALEGPELQGAALFAVFDGHGGADASAFCAAQVVEQIRRCAAQDPSSPEVFLRRALLDLELDLRRQNNTPEDRSPREVPQVAQRLWGNSFDLVGCTAVVALLRPRSVTVVNVGDSRVFKCRDGECVPLSRDHKPESPRERRRIEAAGGTVVKVGPCHRVDANLNLSRTLGDFRYKDPRLNPEDQKISPVGDVVHAEIDHRDEFLVVACDGLFELMTWESVCSFVRDRIATVPLAKIAEDLLDRCCTTDLFATGGRGTDNESVIIVKLNAT